jgi:hypothetical protein
MKSLETFIQEARKNPDQNPKVSVNARLLDYYSNAKTLGYNRKNAFVSFTEIDKLGINPKSSYNTPLGIYAYPMSYVLDSVGSHHTMDLLPFSGDTPYANMFSLKGSVSSNIIIAENFSDNDLDKYYQKLYKLYKAYIPQLGDFINTSFDNAKIPGWAAGRLWYVTKELAETISKGSAPKIWNAIFRKLGIDAFIDDTNLAIIHSNEPTQMVVFNPRIIKDVKRVYNKYSPSYMEQAQNFGSVIKELMYYVKTNDIEMFFSKLEENELDNRNMELYKRFPKKSREYDNIINFISKTNAKKFNNIIQIFFHHGVFDQDLFSTKQYINSIKVLAYILDEDQKNRLLKSMSRSVNIYEDISLLKTFDKWFSDNISTAHMFRMRQWAFSGSKIPYSTIRYILSQIFSTKSNLALGKLKNLIVKHDKIVFNVYEKNINKDTGLLKEFGDYFEIPLEYHSSYSKIKEYLTYYDNEF